MNNQNHGGFFNMVRWCPEKIHLKFMGSRKIRMDIVGMLPTELGQRIMAYLEPEELCCCLCVSQRWRDLANFHYLWKKALPDLETCSTPPATSLDSDNDLCLLAKIYKADWDLKNNWLNGRYCESVKETPGRPDGKESCLGRDDVIVVEEGRLALMKDEATVHVLLLPLNKFYTLTELNQVAREAKLSVGGMTGSWSDEGMILVSASVANLTAVYSYDNHVDKFCLLEVLAFNIRQATHSMTWESSVWYDQSSTDLEEFVRVNVENEYVTSSQVITGSSHGNPVICLKIFNRFSYNESIIMWNIIQHRVVLWVEVACRVRQIEDCWENSGVCVTRGDARLTCYDLDGKLTDVFDMGPSNWLMNSVMLNNSELVIGAVTNYLIGGVELVVWRRGAGPPPPRHEGDYYVGELGIERSQNFEHIAHLDRVPQFARVELRPFNDRRDVAVFLGDTMTHRSLALVLTSCPAPTSPPMNISAVFEIDMLSSKYVLDFMLHPLVLAIQNTSSRLYHLMGKRLLSSAKSANEDYRVVYADKYKVVLFNKAGIAVRNYLHDVKGNFY